MMEDFKSATESLPREFWSYWVINVSSFLPMLSVATGIFTSLPIDVEVVLCDVDVLNGFRKILPTLTPSMLYFSDCSERKSI